MNFSIKKNSNHKMPKQSYEELLKEFPGAIIRKHVIKGTGQILDGKILHKVVKGSESTIYFDPKTNEWQVIGGEDGGIFYISGVVIEMDVNGVWNIWSIKHNRHDEIPDKWKFEPKHTIYTGFTHKRKIEYPMIQYKIGNNLYNLSKKGEHPLKKHGWKLDEMFQRLEAKQAKRREENEEKSKSIDTK
jgi:hypothetical protein